LTLSYRMVACSKLIFGTMRMTEYNYSVSHWVDLFKSMYDNGIRLHHVSSEYDSYFYYVCVLKEFNSKYPKNQILHLVKLAEPHFDSNKFNPKLFQTKVDKYLAELNVSKLWGIQWMWRGDLKNEISRLDNFKENIELLNSKVLELKNNSLIDGFYLFAYTNTFCDLAISLSEQLDNILFDGLTVYRNILESEFDKYLDFFERNIIIRPLFAGKLKTSLSKKHLVEYALNHGTVTNGIISISSIDKLNELLN
jgi:hypothetical protein